MAETTFAPGLDAADSYEAAMKQAFMQYQEKCRLLEAALHEIETLRGEVQALRRGENIVVVVEGKTFSLVSGPPPLRAASLIEPDLRDELSQHLRAVEVEGWQNDQPRQHDTVTLDNSFLLSKD